MKHFVRKYSEASHKTVAKAYGGEGSVQLNDLVAKPEEINNAGYIFSKVCLEPGSSLGSHQHKGDGEIYYILKGKGLYDNNGEDIEMEAGDAAYVYDGDHHGIRNNGDCTLEMLCFIFYHNGEQDIKSFVRKSSQLPVKKIEKPYGADGYVEGPVIVWKPEEIYNKGKAIVRFTINPGYGFAPHKHEGDGELYWIISGKGEYSDNGTPVEVNDGDITFTYDGDVHGLINTGDKPMDMVCFIYR